MREGHCQTTSAQAGSIERRQTSRPGRTAVLGVKGTSPALNSDRGSIDEQEASEQKGLFARMPRLTGRVDFNVVRSAFVHCLDLPPSVIISSFFINLMALALPLVMLQIFDRVVPNRAKETLLLLVVGLACVILIESLLKVARANVMGWGALQKSFANEVDAVNRILIARPGDLGSNSQNIWIQRLDALRDIDIFYGGPARLIIIDLPFVLIFLFMITLIGGYLVLVPLAVFAGFAIRAIIKGVHLRALLQERSIQDERRHDFIIECLSGIQAIKSRAMEPQMQRRFERLQKASSQVSYKAILFGNHLQSSSNFFANAMLISVVSFGALAVMNGQMSIGALACCSLLSSRMVQPLMRGISIWSELQNVSVFEQHAQPLFALPQREPVQSGAERCKGRIVVSNLKYANRTGAGFILNGVDLAIKPGQIIGIRGDDDSGKSLLIKMLHGDVAADEGSVLVDGYDVLSPDYAQIADQICYIGSSAEVFHGTILENITMFRSGGALEEARAAARLIGLEDDIHLLPEGYDTRISGGISGTLPEGLLQRICIARVIAKSPKILLFDKANAMLDLQSDTKLREGLKTLKGRMTIVIASNRPSLLTIADKILQLRNGRLVRVQADGMPLMVLDAKKQTLKIT